MSDQRHRTGTEITRIKNDNSYSLGKWDYRFLILAKIHASFSKDGSTKVGAVIVRPNKTIASSGYNGFPRNVEDKEKFLTDENYREEKYLRVVHAEANAIVTASEGLQGCSFYCTHPPCASCAGLIIQAGITKAIWVTPSNIDFAIRWRKNADTSMLLFEEAGVEVKLAREYDVLWALDGLDLLQSDIYSPPQK